MNLKSLIHRELGEGMTENELASAVEVPVRTIASILADNPPQDPTIWEKFARYFRMDVDFLRTGEPTRSRTMLELPGRAQPSTAGHIRKVPLLNWNQMSQLVTSTHRPDVLHADAVVEATDVSGPCTVAVKVQDDSMEPLFSIEEMIFVNPELEWSPGDYVIARSRERHPDAILLRQVKRIGRRCMLHPLNRKYDDLPLTKPEAVWGKVVRLRKNL